MVRDKAVGALVVCQDSYSHLFHSHFDSYQAVVCSVLETYIEAVLQFDYFLIYLSPCSFHWSLIIICHPGHMWEVPSKDF
jgi:hypothetical protein